MKEDNITHLSVCPRCGKPYHERPALSPLDNGTLICPDCGTREALDSIGLPRQSRTPSLRPSTATNGLNEAVKYTVSDRHVCVSYSSKLTCYYPLLERICVHRKENAPNWRTRT